LIANDETMNSIEFREYISSSGHKLDYDKTNAAFSTLTEREQKEWIDWLSESINNRLQGIPADMVKFDHTLIAYSLRLITDGILWKRGPHKRIRGEPNKCYENCISLLDRKHIIYAGYALVQQEDTSIPRGYFRYWDPHAWLVTKRTNRILETTPIEWLAYFGVPVTPDELLHITTTSLPKGTPHSKNMKSFYDSIGKIVE
jgi:hypothetical protein